MGFPRRLLGEDEELVLVLRPHLKVLLGPVVVLVLLASIVGALIGLLPDGAPQPVSTLVLLAIAAVIAGRWVVRPFAVWWWTLYAITDRRLVTRQGVLRRSGHDMPLSRLNDVSFSHTLLERMLGCGTLVVESAGERGQLRLIDVPRVEYVQRTLYELADRARTGRYPDDEDEDEPGTQAVEPSGSDGFGGGASAPGRRRRLRLGRGGDGGW